MEDAKSIYKKLVEFRKELPKIELDKNVEVVTKSGGKYSYKYASWQEINDKCSPVMGKLGFSFRQEISEQGISTYIFDDKSEILACFYPFTFSGTMQDQGGKITYAKRYSLVAALGISAETDSDAQDGVDDKSNDYRSNKLSNKKQDDDNKSWLNENTPEYQKVVDAIKNGKAEPKDARVKYKVSKKTMAALEQVADNSDLVEDAIEAGL